MSGNDHSCDVAIVGMACRLPGAKNVEEFWRLLAEGVESISSLSAEELLEAGVEPEELANPAYVRAAAILDEVDSFDAGYFGYSPREAELMDPQQRLFLQCGVEALEHAGYGAGDTYGPVGVFAGGKMSTYVFNIHSNPDLARSLDTVEVGLGNDIALLAMRTSYKLDLKGPSYFVQSACSTSLVAIHLACQSLLLDECRMALAGAVAIDFPHKSGYLYREGSLASPDGHVRAFDAAARGTLFGSGLGAVVLKRLDDALADGDRIYAVVKGSATNNDGSGKANFTAPSVGGEARVVLEALVASDVEPDTVSYVEAHGTGTELGDPIEIRALTRAYRTSTRRTGFCAIGSVKTNLGHLDAAAGISGVIKTVLALEHEKIPPSLNFETPNPKIDFDSSPFYVNTKLRDWPRTDTPRRAGVSAFGFGGTNAHLILEEAPPREASGASRPWQLLVLSARSKSALEAATDRLCEHLESHPDLPIPDVAYTLKLGRRGFRERRAVVCRDGDEALAALRARDPQKVSGGTQKLAERPVAFLFSGQGAQHPNMGRELYEGEPAFRVEVDRSAEMLRPLLGHDLRELLYPEPGGESAQAEALRQTASTQLALFVVEYALASLWQEWGVVPAAMIGHSIGEYVAACRAGVFSLQDALALVAARGRLMAEMPAGAMLSVPLCEEEILPRLGADLSLAAVNAPRRTVVAGPPEAIDALAGELQAEDVATRLLKTSHAFHSAMMDPVLERFRDEVAKLKLQAPQIPFLSNVTGTWITDEEATDPGYWASHVRQPVRFAAGVAELLEDPGRALLEVGPGKTLVTFAEETAAERAETLIVASLPHPRDRRSQLGFLLRTLGRLWIGGVEIDGEGFYGDEKRHRVALPTYSFEAQRYWIERQPMATGHRRPPGRIRKIHDIGQWFHVPAWKATLAPAPAAAETSQERRRWLVFVDDSDFARAFVQRLAEEDVTWVRAGGAYSRSGSQVTIDPAQGGDYERLLGDLGSPPDVVLHLWNVADDDGAPSSWKLFRKSQDLGYFSLLSLAQALAAARVETPLRLVVAASRLYDLTGTEPTRPEKATLLGPAMVIPQEHQNVSCRVVDVAPGREDAAPVARCLLGEVDAEDGDLVVAWRGARRWTQTYEAVELAPAEGLGALRERGVYLLTGGLGNVGLLLAEHLARTAQARLVLLGRSAFPARQEWGSYLETQGEDDPRAVKIRRLTALEQLGSEVLVLAADVTDRARMRDVVSTIEERFGALHGVVHAAGVLEGDSIYRPLTEIHRAASEAQFAPKVHGLYVLEEVLADRDLDFRLLLSSNAAILGGLGFVAYSAANAFMDFFALDRARHGRRWLSSDWDEWPVEEERLLQTSMAELSMTREESTDALQRILGAPLPGQVVVATGDLEARHDLWVRGGGAPSAPTELHARPEIETRFEEPASDVERQIAEVWQEVLGIERIGRLDNFFDLGGHSLLATQLMGRLRSLLEIELPLERLFEGPTVADLAAHVETVRWVVLGSQGMDGNEELEEGEL